MKIYAIPIVNKKLTYIAVNTAIKQGRLERVSKYSASKWEEFAKLPENSFRFRAYKYGTKLLNGISHHEWFLKSINDSDDVIFKF